MTNLRDISIEGASKPLTLADGAAHAIALRALGRPSSADIIDRLVDMVARLKCREQELLEANNSYLQRARDAETALADAIKLTGDLALRSAPKKVAKTSVCPACNGSTLRELHGRGPVLIARACEECGGLGYIADGQSGSGVAPAAHG